MIVVLDTNVLIPALVFSKGKGTVYQAVKRALEADTLAIGTELEEELTHVLERSFNWTREQTARILPALFGNAIRVELRGSVDICRDPDDNKVLECAESASASLLVTGDKDLLTLGEYAGIRIVTPAEYLSLPIL
ncbi:putative toxin-antitoxin system toxin component, PIN family [Silvibacterium acidisoli]|uniref:putative toxin-antitoxin system toxin component, PIN family n=1 Tax=Acidobacteriaceae bacterium ZG23-2 TaxID=2883246 RepID=UPI00406CA364